MAAINFLRYRNVIRYTVGRDEKVNDSLNSFESPLLMRYFKIQQLDFHSLFSTWYYCVIRIYYYFCLYFTFCCDYNV